MFSPRALSLRIISALCVLGVGVVQGTDIPFITRTTGDFPSDKVESFLGGAAIHVTPTNQLAQQMGVGWLRADVSWADANPAPGVYGWNETDTIVNEANIQGLRVLLMVRNTPAWAAVTTSYEFDTPGRNSLPQGEHWVITPTVIAAVNQASGYSLLKYDKATGSVVESLVIPKPDNLRMRDSNDFRTFIHALAGRYSAPPYNVKFFQICNEHRPESGQYPDDSVSDVATRWFLPAAEEIHANFPGVKVLVCWGTDVEKAQVDAFEAVPGVLMQMDVFVKHYGSPSRWPKIFDDHAAKGRPDISYWATEYGDKPTTTAPWSVGNEYPHILGLCLEHDWAETDKFKVFWYAFAGNTQPPQALTRINALTNHGRQVRALHSLLYGATFRLAADVTAAPDPNLDDYLYNFQTDRGRVVAIGLRGWSPAGGLVTLLLNKIPPAMIRLARTVDPYGTILENLTPIPAGKGSRLTVNTSLLPVGGTSNLPAEVIFTEIQIYPELILTAQRQGNDVLLSWPSLPGEQFQIDQRSSLTNTNSWTSLYTNWPAAAAEPMTTFVVPNAFSQSKNFYRVQRLP